MFRLLLVEFEISQKTFMFLIDMSRSSKLVKVT